MTWVENLEIIDDYLVEEGEERHVGVLVRLEKWAVWIFNEPVHGHYFAFGLDATKNVRCALSQT